MSRRATRTPTMTRRLAIVVVLAVALVAAVALDRTAPEPTAARPAAALEGGPTIPDASALSVSWYCAEGTSAPDGRADETVMLANLGREEAEAVVSVFPGGDDEPTSERVSVPPLGQVSVAVSDVLEVPESLQPDTTFAGPGVVVEVFGGQVVVEHSVVRGDDLALGPCARQPSPNWYFAAGTTARGVEHVIALFNPFGEDAVVDLSFLTDTGFQAPDSTQGVVVPRRSRVAVPLHEHVRRQERVAVAVEARTGRVVAEQSVVSDGSEIPAGIALSLGATAPASRWALPAGLRVDGGTERVVLANFDRAGSEAEVSTLLPGEAEPLTPETAAVPGRTVVPVGAGANLGVGGEYGVEVNVTGPEPLVVEELMEWTAPADPVGLALEVGMPRPAPAWAFAGAAVDGEATIAVLNPGARPVTVELLAYTSGDLDSPPSAPARVVEPGRRATFLLSEIGVDPDQVILVQADGEVFVQRELVTATGRSLDAGIPEP